MSISQYNRAPLECSIIPAERSRAFNATLDRRGERTPRLPLACRSVVTLVLVAVHGQGVRQAERRLDFGAVQSNRVVAVQGDRMIRRGSRSRGVSRVRGRGRGITLSDLCGTRGLQRRRLRGLEVQMRRRELLGDRLGARLRLAHHRRLGRELGCGLGRRLRGMLRGRLRGVQRRVDHLHLVHRLLRRVLRRHGRALSLLQLLLLAVHGDVRVARLLLQAGHDDLLAGQGRGGRGRGLRRRLGQGVLGHVGRLPGGRGLLVQLGVSLLGGSCNGNVDTFDTELALLSYTVGLRHLANRPSHV